MLSAFLIFLTFSLPPRHPSLALFRQPISQVQGNKRCQSKTLVINLFFLDEGGGEGGGHNTCVRKLPLLRIWICMA